VKKHSFQTILEDLRKSLMAFWQKGLKFFWVYYWKALVIFLLLLVGAFGGYWFYLKSTKIVPQEGGTYIEGVLGQPYYLNPLFAQSQVDFDVSNLVFSGLVRFDEKGEIIGDLAEYWQMSPDGKAYTFKLRPNIFWHDGQPVQVEDIIFSYQIAQHPDYNGYWKGVWRDVKIEKVSEREIRFRLPNPSSFFLTNATMGILPKHILGQLGFSDLIKSPFNLNPIGCGPYKFEKIELNEFGEVSSIILKSNQQWHLPKPYLSQLVFRCYFDPPSLKGAYSRREVMGMVVYDPKEIQNLVKSRNFKIYQTKLPSYLGIFLNLKAEGGLRDKNVRQALLWATPRYEIIQKVLAGQAEAVFQVVLPEGLGYNQNLKPPAVNLGMALDLLEKAGYQDVDRDGIREKGATKLQFNLVVPDNPLYSEIADLLTNAWQKIGVKIETIVADDQMIKEEYIKSKGYDLILYGENLGRDGSLYPYWHSFQIAGSGLNLAGFSNLKVDRALEEARNSTEANFIATKYAEVAQIIYNEVPVILLYRPYFTYSLDAQIKGVELSKIVFPQDRFWGITQWYLNYRRVKK